MSAAQPDPRPQRLLRLASGTSLALVAGFGLALPLPYIAPMLALMLLASRNQALPPVAALALPALLMLTTGGSLLLAPLLQHAPVSGVLLVGLGLYSCFAYQLRGGNALLGTFTVIGLTMMTAAGSASLPLASEVIDALAKGLLLACLAAMVAHWLFPEPPGLPPAPAAPRVGESERGWIALRATLVVLPAYLLALIDPSRFMPLIMQAVNLGQQTCASDARQAARELLGSTLLAGLLAIALWNLLGLFPHLWMFGLWLLLCILLVGRRLYALSPTRLSPGFWLNSLSTMLLLLGQSVQDSDSGKDVYAAFAMRMALFIAVALYAALMVQLIDNRRLRRRKRLTTEEEKPC